MSASRNGAHPGPVLVTGGAGFVGCNVAHRFLAEGRRVRVLDNLSRSGVRRNVAWLRATHGDRVDVRVADVRDAEAVRDAVRGCSAVFHFAAQVAVTTSLTDPATDFDVNARGTLNVLEAARACASPPPVIFTSTNKVYGDLADVPLSSDLARHAPPADARSTGVTGLGVNESRPLDFHSPYGCSKGAADQMVLDWSRSFGLRTVVFRMSCIYGPRQFGTEDQGWLAHFLIRAMDGHPIVLYGDGRQVRDVLFVEDLVDAFQLALANVDRIAGEAFNVGGGAGNTTSLLELLDAIAALRGERPDVEHEAWRTGDQRWYVSDTTKIGDALGWHPRTPLREGLSRLHAWLREPRATAAVESTRRASVPTGLARVAGQGS